MQPKLLEARDLFPDQQAAVETIMEFVEDPSASEMLVEGPAGSGKTSSIRVSINELPKGSKVALATPCGAPTTFLKDYEIHFGDLGFNSYTRKAEIEKFTKLIESIDAVFVDPRNLLGETVRTSWSRQGYQTTHSALGNYVLYRRQGLAKPAS